jgi:hypothetical protein
MAVDPVAGGGVGQDGGVGRIHGQGLAPGSRLAQPCPKAAIELSDLAVKNDQLD